MKYLPGLNRKSVVVAGSVLVIGAATGAAALTSSTPASAGDTTPVEQQVDKNTQELANHDARITNAENNIGDLQKNTGTPASPNNVSVPTTSTSTNITAPAISIVSYSSSTIDDSHKECTVVYSDGTNHSWHWVSPSGINGVCDESLIGQPKL